MHLKGELLGQQVQHLGFAEESLQGLARVCPELSQCQAGAAFLTVLFQSICYTLYLHCSASYPFSSPATKFSVAQSPAQRLNVYNFIYIQSIRKKQNQAKPSFSGPFPPSASPATLLTTGHLEASVTMFMVQGGFDTVNNLSSISTDSTLQQSIQAQQNIYLYHGVQYQW